MSPTRVMIVEDQTVFREMLAELLRLDGAYEVVGVFGAARQALAALDQCRPGLALIDLVLPDLSGLELVRELRARLPALRILVVTAQERPELMRELTAIGAHGIVTKGTPLSELREAVRRVAAGRSYHCPASRAALRPQQGGALAPRPRLSAREQQIVRLVALGQSSKEIAAALEISPKTVANHRHRIARKLEVGDVAGLTRYALAQGWIVEDA